MAKSDTNLPRFLDLKTVAKVFTCETHGQRDFVLQFNQDLSRVRCIDCFEDFLPKTVRSLV